MRKITDPKMQSFIDILGDEYKEMLFEELVQQSDTLEEMSIRKLIAIDSDFKRSIRRKRQSKRFRRMQLMGLVYVCMGAFTFLLSEILLSYNNLSYLSSVQIVQLMSLVVCLVGVLAFILPWVVDTSPRRLAKDSAERLKLQEYEVVTLWRELEGICNDLSARNKAITNKTVIQILMQENLISDEDEQELVAFLRIRNAIVHNSKNKATESEITNSIRKIEKIILKLYKKVLPNQKI